MMPLPSIFGGSRLVGWRLDHADNAKTWDSGEGAFQLGGRWNTKGRRAVYCALDPATAILEVAVHKTFHALDTVPHILTSFEVADIVPVHVVQPDHVPNPNWLRPGVPSIGQQQFGDDLLAKHLFVIIPSTVSVHSWNLIFDPIRASGAYSPSIQEQFALDTRLNKPNEQQF
jgi:RES domain-containing protein